MRIILFFILFIYSFNIKATNVGTIDFENIINSNKYFIDFLDKINNINKKKENDFIEYENKLKDLQEDIEDLSSILSEDDLKIKINDYNRELEKYDILINDHNEIINYNIEFNRKIIINEIRIILEKIMEKNDIDIIFDKNNYIMSIKKIDLSDKIIQELNNIELNLKYIEIISKD